MIRCKIWNLIWIISCTVLMVLTGSPAIAQQRLTLDGKPVSCIIRSDGSDSLTQQASAELQKYIRAISGATVDIKSRKGKGQTLPVYIGKSFLGKIYRDMLESEPMEDAFIIVSNKNGVWLAGKKSLGDLYAVYTLLEEHLGCIRFTASEEYVPETKTILIPAIEKVFSPAFPFRIPAFIGRWDENFSHWHKISNFSDWGMFVHTFQKLVPPEKYFADHPEYFAMVGGRRLQDGQLCLGNPDLRKLLKDNLAAAIATNPGATVWSVSQNDCYNYCECDLCRKMYDAYGSYSGAYIDMANELAAAFPEKQISTLAYQFTRQAPVGIKPLPNVNVMFCSIECNRSMPLEDDPRSAGFVKDMMDWAALTDNIFVWDYVVQFSNYLTPFPNFHVLQPNIRFFRDNGGRMMFQQGSGHSWSDLSDLKQYLIAKLLWNPELNVDSCVRRYISAYYEQAAPFIQQYFDAVQQALEKVKNTQNLDIYGFPVFYKKAHLTPELMLLYENLMNQAEDAVRDHPVLRERVMRVRLPVDFALLDLAINTHSPLMPWVVDEKLNQDMLLRLDQFVERCRLTGVTTINERKFTPEAYRDFVLQKSYRMVANNKLRGADIRSLTPISAKYPVGEELAFTDNLLGGLDFHFNWLGYQGEDMVIVADLKMPVEISKVSMNFLKAVESWVFLPEDVVVEVSEDGILFREVATLRGDNSDRSYLVKSIPYNLSFPAVEVRFLRISARSMKTCPDWHRGFGNPSWIFIDEIIVE